MWQCLALFYVCYLCVCVSRESGWGLCILFNKTTKRKPNWITQKPTTHQSHVAHSTHWFEQSQSRREKQTKVHRGRRTHSVPALLCCQACSSGSTRSCTHSGPHGATAGSFRCLRPNLPQPTWPWRTQGKQHCRVDAWKQGPFRTSWLLSVCAIYYKYFILVWFTYEKLAALKVPWHAILCIL